jgi:hypothetical protein
MTAIAVARVISCCRHFILDAEEFIFARASSTGCFIFINLKARLKQPIKFFFQCDGTIEKCDGIAISVALA